MSYFSELPPECVTEMVPYFTFEDTHSFSLTSKACYDIIRVVSGFKHLDIDLEGKVIEIQFEDNDHRIRSFFLLKLKKDVFSASCQPLNSINALQVPGKPQNDILVLWERATNAKDSIALNSLVVFDLTGSKLTGDHLGSALSTVNMNKPLSFNIVPLIMAHLKAKEISGKCFIAPLKQMVAAGRQDLIKTLLGHPNAHQIPGEELVRPLKLAISTHNKDLLKLIFPHLNRIPAKNLLELASEAVTKKNKDAFIELLSHPDMNTVLNTHNVDALKNMALANEHELLRKEFFRLRQKSKS